VRHLVGFAPADALALPDDAALGIDQPHDGLGRGRAPGTVAPQQGHDFTRRNLELHPMQDVAFAVKGV